MSDMWLTAGAVLIGVVTAALFWTQSLKTKVKMFGLAVLLGLVAATTRLSFGYGSGIVSALLSPPSWKLLALAAAAIGLGVSIIWSLIVRKEGRRER